MGGVTEVRLATCSRLKVQSSRSPATVVVMLPHDGLDWVPVEALLLLLPSVVVVPPENSEAQPTRPGPLAALLILTIRLPEAGLWLMTAAKMALKQSPLLLRRWEKASCV